jgi:hypothetical protein
VEVIESLLTITNEFDVRGKAIRDLIASYIPGIAGRYYGFRNLGDTDVNFPAIMVEPYLQDAKMVSLGKFDLRLTYNLFFFVKDNDPEQVVTLATSLAESLIKLFSNNALGDLSTNFTNQFKAYSGYWLDSEMSTVEISRSYVSATPNDQVGYMRAGLMRLTIQDVVIK